MNIELPKNKNREILFLGCVFTSFTLLKWEMKMDSKKRRKSWKMRRKNRSMEKEHCSSITFVVVTMWPSHWAKTSRRLWQFTVQRANLNILRDENIDYELHGLSDSAYSFVLYLLHSTEQNKKKTHTLL